MVAPVLFEEVYEPETLKLISLDSARQFTSLDLVSAREVRSEGGRTYHELEAESESASHSKARDAAIGFFRSIGYQIFPEGVGIRGVYTLADFLAIRPGRTVFVEVLSDDNVTSATLSRKAQLQAYGELCFVVYSGTKKATDSEVLALKRGIEQWADVVYCSLNSWTGINIEPVYRASVAYDTTRDRGIRVALEFSASKRKVAVSVRFVTQLYRNPFNTRISHTVLAPSYCYEGIFLDVFRKIARRRKLEIKLRRGRQHITAFRAMRRKSGLKMVEAGGRVISSLMSAYRGALPIDLRRGDYHPPSLDIPPENFYGEFLLERTGPDGLTDIISGLRECGFTLDFSSDSYENAMAVLAAQLL